MAARDKNPKQQHYQQQKAKAMKQNGYLLLRKGMVT
jgi:hypothetical protein